MKPALALGPDQIGGVGGDKGDGDDDGGQDVEQCE